MKTYIIGLCGPAGVGKSTTASSLTVVAAVSGDVPEGSGAMDVAFATPLYESLAAMLGRSVDELRKTKSIPWTDKTAPVPSLVGKTPRWALQILGTECVRKNFADSFWVERMQAAVADKAAMARERGWVKPEGVFFAFVEDVRFANEAHACDLLVELTRKGVAYSDEHASAQRLPFEKLKVPVLHYSIDNISYKALFNHIWDRLRA